MQISQCCMGSPTKRLNEQVKRNASRFPHDFMFQLTREEKSEVVANCDHLSRLKFSPSLPHAFTEHGAIMAATVLNSPQAVQMAHPNIASNVHNRCEHSFPTVRAPQLFFWRIFLAPPPFLCQKYPCPLSSGMGS